MPQTLACARGSEALELLNENVRATGCPGVDVVLKDHTPPATNAVRFLHRLRRAPLALAGVLPIGEAPALLPGPCMVCGRACGCGAQRVGAVLRSPGPFSADVSRLARALGLVAAAAGRRDGLSALQLFRYMASPSAWAAHSQWSPPAAGGRLTRQPPRHQPHIAARLPPVLACQHFRKALGRPPCAPHYSAKASMFQQGRSQKLVTHKRSEK